jgi:hypothetical protein
MYSLLMRATIEVLIHFRNFLNKEVVWVEKGFISMPHISSRSGVVSKGNAVIGWAQASSALRE